MYYITENYRGNRLASLVETVAELCFPSNTYCLCCGKIVDNTVLYSICDYCRERIQWGNIVVDMSAIRQEIGRDIEIDSISAAAHYGLFTRPIVEQFKNGGRTYIARHMAEIMWERLAADENAGFLRSAEIVVPAPTGSGEKERGFNHSKKLAHYISMNMEAVMMDCLQKGENAGTQKSAGGLERFINIKGSIGIKNEIQGETESKLFGKRVLLIDDVCTTGATLNECAAVLKAAGASEVHGLVFATGNHHSYGYFG